MSRRHKEEDYGHYGPQRPRAGLGFHGDDDHNDDDDRDLAHLPPALQLPPLPAPGPPPAPAPPPTTDRRRGPRLTAEGLLPGFVRAQSPATRTATEASDDGAVAAEEECPGALYAELLQRAPEAEEVVLVLGDGEVEVIEAPVRRAGAGPPRAKRFRRRRRRTREERRNGGGGGGREDAEGVIVLDSDDDDGDKDGGGRKEAMAAAAAASEAAGVVAISSSSSSSSGSDSEAAGAGGGFFCEVCREQVASMPRRAHERTTLHVFNARKDEPLAESYNRITLPASNRGVRILARMGWDAEAGKGLGREGQGRVEPAKSMLKLDRKGLGHVKQPKARVTHFPAHSEEEARRAGDGKSEAQRRVEEAERLRREGAGARGGGAGGGKGGGGGSGAAFETAAQRARRLREEKERRERIMRELNEDHAVDVRLRGPQAAGRVNFVTAVSKKGRQGQGEEPSLSGLALRPGREREDEEAPGFGRVERPRSFWPT